MIVLETKRLYLREWVPDDWVRFKPLVVDPRVTRYISRGGGWSDEQIEQRVKEYIQFGRTRGWHLWPVIHRDDVKLIGFCGFSDGFPPDVEIGWRLLPEYWGMGLATEIAQATLIYGFRTWGFRRVISVAQVPNRASVRVMEKIGMRLDAELEDHGHKVVRYVIENPHCIDATTAIGWRDADTHDVALLASMNQHLIADEASQNPMSLAELETRMQGFLKSGWQATFILVDDTVVGYCLYRFRTDEYQPSRREVYVRQFFVEAAWRNQGIGRRAFVAMSCSKFSDASAIVLDVLESNPRGQRFWEAVGFQPHYTTMRASPQEIRGATDT